MTEHEHDGEGRSNAEDLEKVRVTGLGADALEDGARILWAAALLDPGRFRHSLGDPGDVLASLKVLEAPPEDPVAEVSGPTEDAPWLWHPTTTGGDVTDAGVAFAWLDANEARSLAAHPGLQCVLGGDARHVWLLERPEVALDWNALVEAHGSWLTMASDEIASDGRKPPEATAQASPHGSYVRPITEEIAEVCLTPEQLLELLISVPWSRIEPNRDDVAIESPAEGEEDA
jgi:hypothetical protein